MEWNPRCVGQRTHNPTPLKRSALWILGKAAIRINIAILNVKTLKLEDRLLELKKELKHIKWELLAMYYIFLGEMYISILVGVAILVNKNLKFYKEIYLSKNPKLEEVHFDSLMNLDSLEMSKIVWKI